MALVASTLSSDLIAALQGLTSAADAMSTLSSTVTDYVKNNAEFEFAWTAVNPGDGSLDPDTKATGEFVTLEFVSTPSGLADQSAAITALKTDFILSLTAATYNITQSGFSTAPGSMASSPSLGTLTFDLGSTDDRLIAFDSLSQSIVDWVVAQVPAAPCSGSHAAFVGAGVVTVVI